MPGELKAFEVGTSKYR